MEHANATAAVSPASTPDPTVWSHLADGPAASEPSSACVHLVVHDRSLRDSLETLIEAAGWQADTFASPADLAARPPADQPSCVVLEMTQPDDRGIEVQRRLTVRSDLPVICIARHSDLTTAVQAMKAGAVDFLLAPVGEAVLRRAIAVALERCRTARQHTAQVQRIGTLHGSLTPREREVMVAVVSGLLNKQIASELGISEITVKAHRGQVMRKMRAGSVAELVTMAAHLGIGHVFVH
jgi:FixJ family two-component response regulator